MKSIILDWAKSTSNSNERRSRICVFHVNKTQRPDPDVAKENTDKLYTISKLNLRIKVWAKKNELKKSKFNLFKHDMHTDDFTFRDDDGDGNGTGMAVVHTALVETWNVWKSVVRHKSTKTWNFIRLASWGLFVCENCEDFLLL